MSSISQILNTSKQALLAQQAAIDITGANVANVNTAGYSRQRVVLTPMSTQGTDLTAVQSGVVVTDIERIYDQFMENQIVQQAQRQGYSETQKDGLDRIEVIFNESDGNGLNDLLSEFWKAWEDLSNNPSGQVERLSVVSAGENLASAFQTFSQRIQDVQAGLNNQVSDAVTQVNTLLNRIAGLNPQIVMGKVGGASPNALLDQRSELLKQLGQFVDINYIEESDGTLDVFLANGKPLVEGDSAHLLAVQPNVDNHGYYDIVFKDDTSGALNDVITGGKLGSLLDIRDTTAAGYLAKLDTLASQIIVQVNEQHAKGFDNYQNVGGNFFTPVTSAQSMAVDSAILADSGKIAASSTISANGENARTIAALQDNAFTALGEMTFNNYYSALVGQVGQDVANAQRSTDQETSIMSKLQDQSDRISGVSIDEEMINLTKFQFGYQAAARLTQAADELFQTLIDMAQ